MSSVTAIKVWIPALRKGAPSNAAGIRGAWTAYPTRAAAMLHWHWANQAPWATARSVIVSDTSPTSDDVDYICEKILLCADELGEHDPASLRAAALLREGRRIDAILALFSTKD